MRTAGDLLDAPDSALAYRVLEPAPRAPRRLLVLLHGVGGQERQLAALGSRFDADTLVALPRGPHRLGADAYGWFRVAFLAGGPVIVAEEAEDSRRRLIALVGELQRQHGIAPSHTVIAGFSQGGILSTSVALSAPQAVAGFGLWCGRILPELAPALAPRSALATLDGLVMHGRADDKLPVAWAERADAWLTELGVPHRTLLHTAGHELTAAMQTDLLAWFNGAERRWMR